MHIFAYFTRFFFFLATIWSLSVALHQFFCDRRGNACFNSAKWLQNLAFSMYISRYLAGGRLYCRMYTFLGPDIHIFAYIKNMERLSGLYLVVFGRCAVRFLATNRDMHVSKKSQIAAKFGTFVLHLKVFG